MSGWTKDHESALGQACLNVINNTIETYGGTGDDAAERAFAIADAMIAAGRRAR